jgi:ATP-dependent DNA ligase
MQMKTFPKLYKKSSTGAIQEWSISVVNQRGNLSADIVTSHGQVDGKIQVVSDSIREGKNIGKKNDTSAVQQAEAEALAKWEKQKKKGYVESIIMAEAGELDDLIEGGVVPMLAHKFSDQGHKIKYPAFVQPKLDGIRCVAIVQDGVCTLWSRTRKQITSMPHIIQELEAMFPVHSAYLDGELYNHDFKANFEHIVSMVRQEVPHENHMDVQYHVYDMITEGGFQQRTAILAGLFEVFEPYTLKFVETLEVKTEEEVMTHFEKFRKLGYEGAMLRNRNGIYVNKRSYDLQKVKEFDDAEFNIVGIEEGRGKLQGHVGSFVCTTPDGKEFLAKMSGDTERLREYYANHSLWTGKVLTVKYQGLTGKNGVPRFPVGVSIRDYE